MTAKELRQCGIKIELVDNGYREPKTYKYTHESRKAVITIDKDNFFGIKSYVMEINGKEATNFFGKTLRWETLEEAQSDVVEIFNGNMPKHSYTMA